MLRRRTSLFITLASAILFLFACVMWAGSQKGVVAAIVYVHRVGTDNRWLVQLHFDRRGMHGIIVFGGASGPARIRFERAYLAGDYAGGSRHHTIGFIFARLATTRRGTDYVQNPFTALVIPYWFIVATTAVLPLRWIYHRRRWRRTPGGFAIVTGG